MDDPNLNPTPGPVDPSAVASGISQGIDESGVGEAAKAAAAPPPPPVATSKNPALHNLIGSVLGGLAGTPPPSYSYDESGKLISKAAPALSTADKIRRIASNALTGLSASVNTPNQKSGLANILAGGGVGAEAVVDKMKKDDILKRAQAKENFEETQQTMLRKHEIARQNALTLSTYYGAKKMANEMDPHFAQNEGLVGAVKASPELGAHVTEMSDSQLEQEVAKDPAFATTHIVKPLGWAPETDENGQQVSVNGEPKFYMRMAVIDGTKDGKIAVTPEMAEDIKKYGAMARIPNAGDIKAGDTYELSQLLPLMNKIDEQRKVVLDGWAKSELGWTTGKDGKEVPVETNKMIPPDQPGRSRPLTVEPMAMKAEESKSAEQEAQGRLADAKAKEALANAALISNAAIGGNDKNSIPAYMDAIGKLPQSSQAILRNVSPNEQMSLLKVANGDADLNKVFPTRTTKGSGQLDASRATNLVSLINKDWSQQLYSTKQKAMTSFADGEDGKAIASFGQFLVHADRARMASENLPRTSSAWLNEPINVIKNKGMGQPGVAALMTDIMQARNEWQTFIKNGHASDLADSDAGRAIMSDASAPAVILGALREMGHGAIGRLDQIDAKWRRTWGGHYPGLISDSARQGAIGLGLGEDIKQYPGESGAFGGVQAPAGSGPIQSPDNPAQRPAGATGIAPGSDGKMHYHDIKGNDLGVAPASVQ